MTFSITIGGQSSQQPYSSGISYAAPVLSAFAASAATIACGGGLTFTATGSSVRPHCLSLVVLYVRQWDADLNVLLRAPQFGPTGLSSPVTLSYGPTGVELSAACSALTAQTTVQCVTSAGAGRSTRATLTIAGQTSAALVGSSLSYRAPVVSGVSPPQLVTDGGQTVTITGTDLVRPISVLLCCCRPHTCVRFNQGVPGTVVSASYVAGANPAHAATNCAVVSTQQMTCKSVPGADISHAWTVPRFP